MTPSQNNENSDQENPQSAETLKPPQGIKRLNRIIRHAPTFLVIAALTGIGIYGHRTDWKLPKFSALTGSGAIQREDWCEEHAVPESQCVECHPELLPRVKDYGWCKEHSVHNCPQCHPEVAQLKQTPEGIETDRVQAARAIASAALPENNPICKNYRRRIQFASHDSVQKAGVDVALVDRQPIAESISANGQITYDQTRFASLSSRLSGTVWQVEKNVGDRVQAGEVLALIDAAEVGRAKIELIQALAHEHFQQNAIKRLESITDIVSGGKLQEFQTEGIQARSRLLSAQQTLANLGLPVHVEQLRGLPDEKLAGQLRILGLPENQARKLDSDEATSNLLPIKAPLDGTIVTRHVVAGEMVDASRVLFQLADTNRMWLTLNVTLEDAGKLALGQPVRFRPDGNHDEVSGTLVWISTTADPKTRMVSVRAELPNPEGKLRNETFGRGRIVLREEQEALVVPSEAIHWEGCCHVVFVRDKAYFEGKNSPKVFHIRTVKLGNGKLGNGNLADGHQPDGLAGGKFTEIVAGVLPGEVVATKGSDVLKAELLKNNLGEGCTCCK